MGWKPRSLALANDECPFTRRRCVKPGGECEVVSDDGEVVTNCQYRLWEETRQIAGRAFPDHAWLAFKGGRDGEVSMEDGGGSSKFDAVALFRPTWQVIAFEIQAVNITGSHKTATANLNLKDAAWKLCYPQILEKGRWCHEAGVPLYWVMQGKLFDYLHRQAPFQRVEGGTLQFHVFDYTSDGLGVVAREEFHTTYEEIVRCMLPSVPCGSNEKMRQDLVGRIFNDGGLYPFDPTRVSLSPHVRTEYKGREATPEEIAAQKQRRAEDREAARAIFEAMMASD